MENDIVSTGGAIYTALKRKFLSKIKVNYSTLHPLSHRNKIGDKFGDPTTVTV